MSADDEVIPPRRGLPAPSARQPPSPIGETRRVNTGGVVRSAMTGWQAKTQARALAQITERTRNETALLRAQAELAGAYETTALKANRLRKLPQILALDDAQFRAEQRAGYDAIEERQAEREDQVAIKNHRRQREIEDAKAEVVEARRRKFTSAQGYENQRRLKDRNLKTWETRAEALRLDAEAKAAKVRGQVHSNNTDRLGPADEIRRKAEVALTEALADGNDAEVDRWHRILDALS
jgi:hypothetical protein